MSKKQEYWVARDKSGELFMYQEEPLLDACGAWIPYRGFYIMLPKEHFQECKAGSCCRLEMNLCIPIKKDKDNG